MNNFFIKNIDVDSYDIFLLLLSSDSLFDELDFIENAINTIKNSGKIIIDQLLLTGNNKNRFITCDFECGKLKLDTCHIVSPPIVLREITTKWLQSNFKYVENSILTYNQRNQIKNGLTI